MEHLKCCCCGSGRFDKQYDLDGPSLYKCGRCGLTIVHPRPAADRMNRKIQSWAEQDVLDGQRLEDSFGEAAQAVYRRYLGRLERGRRTNGRRLLDIGCATGAFLQAAGRGGWKAEGIEIGEASWRHACKIGLSVRNMSFSDIPESENGTYDAVTCLEVIEHLEDPAAAISLMNRLLRPEGLLLLSTPNYDSFIRKRFGPRWWVINCPDEHISLFNVRSLRRCVEDRGFEVLRVSIPKIDIAGMLKLSRSPEIALPEAPRAPGYYGARDGKVNAKRLLKRSGLYGAAKTASAGLDRLSSWPVSPIYGWGERLILLARKKA